MRTVLVCVRTPLAAQNVASAAARLGLAAAVRTAVSDPEVMLRLAERPPDVVLADTAITRPDSVGFTRRVLARAPGAAILLFGAEEPGVASAAIAAGARGLIQGGDHDLVSVVAKAIMLLAARGRAIRGAGQDGAALPTVTGTAMPGERANPAARMRATGQHPDAGQRPGTEPRPGAVAWVAARPGALGSETGTTAQATSRGGTMPPVGADPATHLAGRTGPPVGAGTGPAGAGTGPAGKAAGGPPGVPGVVPVQRGDDPGGDGEHPAEGAPSSTGTAEPPAGAADGRSGAVRSGETAATGDAGRSEPGTPVARHLVLTEREMQVLLGMADGKSNAEIGRELYVSEDTVKTHARRLFRKLGARDRAHAVAAGFRAGLVA
ncbi:response regulator transcription factor [Micromonospora sp. NPDC003197]